MLSQHEYIQILEEELVPALGCTEPISLAYGAARAKAILGSLPERVTIACSPNIIKNVKSVVVPHTGGMRGIESAIAIGLVGGDASRGLEVLDTVTDAAVTQAGTYLANHHIEVVSLLSEEKLHYILKLFNGEHSVLIEVKGSHTNIVRIDEDGKAVHVQLGPELPEIGAQTDPRSSLKVEDIIGFCKKVDTSLLEPLLQRQIQYNQAICQEGIKNHWGASVGRTLMKQGTDFLTVAKAVTAAGSDARMSGCEMPVVINSGSGNQGIAVSMPVISFAQSNGTEHSMLLRALAMSNLIAIRQKVKIGRLSAYCGAVSAAIGAGSAITYLSGGSLAQIEQTITNTLATISGMVCDGAKPSCAAKISVAVEAAFLGHRLAMEHEGFMEGEGLVGANVEETIDSIGTLASEGMLKTDEVIVDLMVGQRRTSK